MELTHDFTVPADPETVWRTFTDLEQVGSCFPGATVTEVTDEGFSGTVKVKLGPIALQYAGSGHFVEKDDAAKRAVIEAKGKDKRGNGTAGATVVVQLAADGSGTKVDVVTDLAVTGKPAQFGRGVMQDVSDKLLGQFVGCIEGRLTEAGGAGAESEAAAESAAAAASETAEAAAGASVAGESVPAATSEPEAVAEAPTPTSTPAPSPAPAPRPTPRSTPAGGDDALDLGSTVLPVLVRTYGPYVAVGVLGLVVGWLIGRR